MKVGDLVQWYTEYADGQTTDLGIILEYCRKTNAGVYVHWFSNDGSGWFDTSHPSIEVISHATTSS